MEKHLIERSNATDGENIAKGALSLGLSAILVKVLGLIYKVPLSYILTDEGMGYFNSAYTVYIFFYLIASAGIPKAISILSSEYLAKNREEDVNRIFRFSLLVFFLGGVLLGGIFTCLSSPLSSLVGNSAAKWAMYAIAPSLPFIAMGGVMRGYLNARMKLLPIALSQLIEGAGKLIFGLLLAMYSQKQGYDLPTIAAFTIFGITAASVLSYAFLLFAIKGENKDRRLPKLKSELKRGEILKRIAAIAVPVTVSAGIVSITNLCDLSLIMHRLEALGYAEEAASALYGNYTTLAVPMFNLVATVVSGVSVAILPSLTRRHILGLDEEFRDILSVTFSTISFFTVPIMLGFIVFPAEVLGLMFSKESVLVGASLLAMLAPAIVFMSILTAVNTALEASGFVRAPLITMGVGSAVKLIVSYFLIGNSSFGIYGAPIGTVASYLAGLLVGAVLLGKKKGIPLGFIGVFLKPLVFGGVAVSLTVLLRNCLHMQKESILHTLVSMVFCILIYLVFSWISGAFDRKSVIKLSKYTKNA